VDAIASISDDRKTLQLVNVDGTTLTTIPIADVKVSPRLAKVPRRLDFPNGDGFATPANDSIDAMLQTKIGLHRLESSWRIILLSILFAGLATAGFAL